MLAVLFVLVALWPLHVFEPPRAWAAIVALVLALVAWRAPHVYATPTRWWLKLGELLARIVAPIALAVLYFGMFVPIAWLMRVTGRRPLHLNRDPALSTYWIEREQKPFSRESLGHPF